MAAIGAIPVRRVPTHLGGLLGSIRQMMEPQARAHDVTLTLEVGDDVPGTVIMDDDKVAWAILALIGNALRYVRHGTQRMPGGSIAIRASHDRAGREVTVEVQDDGPGIAPETLQLLTGTNRDRARPGLALAMIRDVVEAHGGRVDIQSRTDASIHGTTVRLTLPIS
jgi:signal transduction histidine kinase